MTSRGLETELKRVAVNNNNDNNKDDVMIHKYIAFFFQNAFRL